MFSIVLTGGGTAGHCIPNIALLPYLKKKFNNIYYFGSNNGIEKKLIENENIKFYDITCVKFDRSNKLKNISIPYKLLKGITEAKIILKKLKPDIVFSKGGYVSIPTVIAAYKLNIPVIAHESDLTMGMANKFTSRFCKKILTSFPETAQNNKNCLYVGPPIRGNILNIKPNIDENYKPTILVVGGSQGAEKINSIVRESLEILIKKYNIIHICGKNKLSQNLNIKGYTQIEYSNNIENLFKKASICVSRAGSNTVFELLCMKKPSILIPLPKGNSRGDQILNAKYFENKGLVKVIEQNNLNPKTLIETIDLVNKNKNLYIKKINDYNIKPSNEKIVNIICDYLI